MEFKITHIASLLKDCFPADFVEIQKAEAKEKNKYKFRLLDGDRNVYFKGIASRNDSFDPLDFFGSEFGCTDIQYYEFGKYVSL